MVTKSNLPKNILFFRKKLQLSQQDLAHKIGCTPNSISLYERGKAEPAYQILHKLADVFSVTTDELYFEKFNQQKYLKFIKKQQLTINQLKYELPLIRKNELKQYHTIESIKAIKKKPVCFNIESDISAEIAFECPFNIQNFEQNDMVLCTFSTNLTRSTKGEVLFILIKNKGIQIAIYGGKIKSKRLYKFTIDKPETFQFTLSPKDIICFWRPVYRIKKID